MTLKSVNNVIGTVADGLKSLIPGFGEASFKSSWEKLLNSVDSSTSAGWLEGMFITAPSNCNDPNTKFSDTGENMRLPEALKHFGDLYGDNNPNTKPTLDDLKLVKAKVKCYNNEFRITNNKGTPEQIYFLDLTSDIEKLLDAKIQTMEKSADSPQTQLGGAPVAGGAAAISDGAILAKVGDIPYRIEDMRVHYEGGLYDGGKRYIMSEFVSRVGVGSCGAGSDDLCFGFELTENTPVTFGLSTSLSPKGFGTAFGYKISDNRLEKEGVWTNDTEYYFNDVELLVSKDNLKKWVVLKNAHKNLKDTYSNGFRFSFADETEVGHNDYAIRLYAEDDPGLFLNKLIENGNEIACKYPQYRKAAIQSGVKCQ
jgi:hypothetical protein